MAPLFTTITVPQSQLKLGEGGAHRNHNPITDQGCLILGAAIGEKSDSSRGIFENRIAIGQPWTTSGLRNMQALGFRSGTRRPYVTRGADDGKRRISGDEKGKRRYRFIHKDSLKLTCELIVSRAALCCFRLPVKLATWTCKSSLRKRKEEIAEIGFQFRLLKIFKPVLSIARLKFARIRDVKS